MATSEQYLNSGKKTIINANDLKEKLDNSDNSLLVDIRDAVDYQKGHITKAVNIPLRN
ncbi:rhodanese-like domain-containing protein [Anaerobacillus sp. HL2]|nr:rhodanese-like domain-containing protein [Anaerobacillus sp. HL2]